MITEYELFSDERYKNHELLLGGLICTHNGAERIAKGLMNVRDQFGLKHEVHWSNGFTASYFYAYKAWADVFLKDNFARFCLFRVNRSLQEWKQFKKNENDRLKSAYHQFLLICFGKLGDLKRWTVFPDSKFLRDDKDFASVEFLFNRTYKDAFGPKTSRIIRMVVPSNSKQLDLIQLTDFLLGAFDFDDKATVNQPKIHLRRYCKFALDQAKTGKGFDKLNVQRWVLPNQYRFA